jgi:putative ABC transport system permease protein
VTRTSMPFWARSVRRRPAAAVVLALLALVATVVSVLAPLLLRAVEQAALDDAVARAGVAGTSIAASAEIEYQKLSEAQGAVVATTAGATGGRLWHDDVVVAESKAPVVVGDRDSSTSPDAYPKLAGLSNDCRSLGLVSGDCPSGTDEVLAAADSGLTVGTSLRLTVLDVPEQVVRVHVVGTYDPSTRVGRVVSGPGARFGGGDDAASDLVMSLGGFDELSVSGTMWSIVTLRHGLRLDDLPTVARDVAAARDGTLTESSAASSVSVQERIGLLADRVADEDAAATTIVAVSALQAVVLAWFAQGVVAGRIGQARAAEWGLARLRGLPARRRRTAVLLEPVLATVVGTVAGAAAGLGVAAVCAPLLIGPGAPALEPFRAPVLLALAASAVGSIVALVVASSRAARVPLVDLLRRVTEPRTLSRTGAVVQAVAVIAAVVGLEPGPARAVPGRRARGDRGPARRRRPGPTPCRPPGPVARRTPRPQTDRPHPVRPDDRGGDRPRCRDRRLLGTDRGPRRPVGRRPCRRDARGGDRARRPGRRGHHARAGRP